MWSNVKIILFENLNQDIKVDRTIIVLVTVPKRCSVFKAHIVG